MNEKCIKLIFKVKSDNINLKKVTDFGIIVVLLRDSLLLLFLI